MRQNGHGVVRTKRKMLVFRDKQGADDPCSHRVFRIERTRTDRASASHETPVGAWRAEQGWHFEAHPVSRSQEVRAEGRERDFFLVPTENQDWYATQETDVGWVIHRPEPSTTERTSAARRRCPSREPTCPRGPNATHAPDGKPCPAAARPRSLPPSPMGNRRNNRVHVRPNGLSGRANEMGQGGGTLTPRLLPTVHRGNQDQVERRAGQPTKQDVSGRGL